MDELSILVELREHLIDTVVNSSLHLRRLEKRIALIRKMQESLKKAEEEFEVSC